MLQAATYFAPIWLERLTSTDQKRFYLDVLDNDYSSFMVFNLIFNKVIRFCFEYCASLTQSAVEMSWTMRTRLGPLKRRSRLNS